MKKNYFLPMFITVLLMIPVILVCRSPIDNEFSKTVKHSINNPVWPTNPDMDFGKSEIFISGDMENDLFPKMLPLQGELDFGDDPDQPYPTLLGSNGARHQIVSGIYLGNLIDAEPDGQPNAPATGDDVTNTDDEDGVFFTKPFVAGKATTIKVKASVTGYLNAWFDFNKNGSWTNLGEQVCINTPLTAGINSIIINVPAGASPGYIYTRFRFDSKGGLNFYGYASDGEVEDYRVTVYPPNWGYNPTNSTHLISVPENILFNCVNLSNGDFIGTFYTNELGNLSCGGVTYWDGVNNQVVVAFGDDPTTAGSKEGFAENEPFLWKVYHSATGIEEIVVVGYSPALPNFDGKYHDNGLSALIYVTDPVAVNATATPTVLCEGDEVQLNAEVTGGCPPYTFQWSSQPAGFSSNLQNPTDSPVVTTMYFVTVNDGYTSASDQVTVTVIPDPGVICPYDLSLCVDSYPIGLNGGTPEGGNYSGTGVVDGVFYAGLAGVGEHTITYTYTIPGTNCSWSCEFIIKVYPTPQVDCPSFMRACEGDPKVLLNTAYPQGGEYSGIGVSFDGFNYWFDPAIGVGTHVITYCYSEPPIGCDDCCEFNFYVRPLPVVDCPDDFTVCIDTPPFDLTGATPTGGQYSGDGVSGGVFDPAAAGPGVHIITYTYTNPNSGCTNFCEFKITVIEVIVECPDDMAVCLDEPAFELTGATPEGGFYSGTGVSGGWFDPAVAGVGFHTITYTYVVPGTNCTGTCTFVIHVKPLPQVDCPPFMEACLNDPPVKLDQAYPLGGNYFGPGVYFDGSDYWFNPDIGIGTYIIHYCFTDPGTGCSDCCEFPMYVRPLPNVTCPEDFSVCYDTDPFILTGGLPIPGTYSGWGVWDNKFYPALAGVGNHTITYCYFDPQWHCENCCEFVITVLPAITPDCPDDFGVCLNDLPFVLTGATPEGGIYSGPGVSGGIFDPAAAGVGFHTITYTVGGVGSNCYGSCEFVIDVKPLPQVDCPGDFEVCFKSPSILLNNAWPQGGVYSGAGVFFDGGFYWFDPSVGLGDFVITYCFTEPSTGCTNCCEFIITVYADHIIQLPEGWSGVSSFIAPDNPDITQVMYPIFNELIQIYNFNGLYWPDGGSNTLGNWDEYSGYFIKVSDDAVLPICGSEVFEKTVYLNEGWNIIPVLSSYPYDIVSLFTATSGFQIAKEIAGTGIYWPMFGINTIGMVKPGKAYLVRMSAPGSITYSLPAYGPSSGLTHDKENIISPWNNVVFTPSSHIVVFNLGEKVFETGDIIGGFTADGLCAGIISVDNVSSPFAINMFGDDPFTFEADGFAEGENIIYNLYRPSTGETFTLSVTYNPDMNTGLFENNGLSEVRTVKLTSTGLVEFNQVNIRIYPNPSQGIFNLSGFDGNAQITVLNTYGEEIIHDKLTLPGTLDLTGKPDGVYFIRIESNKGMFFEKLIVK